ncbi:flagellar biosynthetic protein FlhB [Salinihabitans flavidus]|uniref:Flagellar biosynthetic protein FlhB n=1 Tax=Salinihabitans flavidus TaxID=569882 RepID=A0A1H8LQQ9_9RHOB|nr:flagellar type III secretion system protein FlhB [Salinihabitans flavidus]SEO07477.1 flagellar biosynthetic protein FlhB [Salinihabitans flavidus]
MNAQGEEAEKSHEPTQKKLDDARKKGEIARSTDLYVAASYAGFLLALLASGAYTVGTVGEALLVLIDQAPELSLLVFEGHPSTLPGGLMRGVAIGLAPLFLIPAGAVILAVLAQRAFVVAPEKLMLKASRINPVQNAKNKYGRGGLFEFAKSFAKLVTYSICLAFFLRARLSEMAGSIQADPHVIAGLLARLGVEFLSLVLVIALAIGVIDYLWQWQEHRRKNMMSRKELTDETKESEGDPHMKQGRRAKAQEIANSHMLADVPDASVVIVNPMHYAVALSWSRKRGEAPICIAKGVDEIAKRIRDIAGENGVPVRSDPPVARALYAVIEIGDEIPTDHYRAVAAAIRFADAMRERAWR